MKNHANFFLKAKLENFRKKWPPNRWSLKKLRHFVQSFFWILFHLIKQIFPPHYKYFDQLLPTVKNKTTVPNLVFKELLQTSIPPLISVFHTKGYHDFPLRTFCLTVCRTQETFCLPENIWYQKSLYIREREEVSKISVVSFVSKCGNFVQEPFCVSQSLWYRKFFWITGLREGVLPISVKNFLSHSEKKSRRGIP